MRTKLYVPVVRPDPATRLRTNFIPRPRLIAQLNEGWARRLTLISAPAGFGKTTLVSSWLEQTRLSAAWLSLDPEDNDFARFWIYLIAALQTVHPDIGQTVSALLQSSPGPPSSHALLTPLLNDLTAVSDPFILVLDDYHAIENETIDQSLTFFIERLPSSLHLVISSRMDPNVPLARLRANGQLQELRSADLRFTPDETAQFLRQMIDQNLAVEQVAALDRRIEGWIAGLQLAALSLRQREAATVAQFIQEFTGSHRYIMDYLVDEVLQRQPAEVQTFLLYTSILDRLCGPLCQALLQEGEVPGHDRGVGPPEAAQEASSAQELLIYLERANLFITPLDDQHYWYRYHPLFADLLRHRLQQTHPDRVSALHLSASQWYAQAGLFVPAVQHALAAQAFGRAAALIEQVALVMFQRSEIAKLLTWFDTLPEDEVQARPLLALFFVRALFLSGQMTQATERLKAIEAGLATDEAQRTPEVQGHIAIMQAYLAREAGDLASTIALSRRALTLLPEQDALLRAMVTVNLAIAHYLRGEFEPASQLLIETIATGQTAQLMLTTLSALHLNTQILRARGSLQQAMQLCQEGLELVARRGWHNFPTVGYVDVAFGELLRERNELSKAVEYLENGIELGQAGGHHYIMLVGYVWLAWLRQTLGDVTGSHEAIRAAFQLVQHDPGQIWGLPRVACYQVRLWIAQGNLTAASRWAQESGLNPADTTILYLHEVEYLTLARLFIAQGNLEAAESLLDRLHHAAAAAERNGSLIEILILQAITFEAQDRREQGLEALEQALRLAEPEGFVRIFLDEGTPMVELLRRAVAEGLHATYALRLLNALGETAPGRQPLAEPLSGRELEVLRRLAAGYSNQEIAQELMVAVSTVKKHINNIYGKLEVGSRTRAVARARELGLL